MIQYRHCLFPMNDKRMNSNFETIPLNNTEKQINYEVQREIFNRKIEIKTKQEEMISSTNFKSSIRNQSKPTSDFLFLLTQISFSSHFRFK